MGPKSAKSTESPRPSSSFRVRGPRGSKNHPKSIKTLPNGVKFVKSGGRLISEGSQNLEKIRGGYQISQKMTALNALGFFTLRICGLKKVPKFDDFCKKTPVLSAIHTKKVSKNDDFRPILREEITFSLHREKSTSI